MPDEGKCGIISSTNITEHLEQLLGRCKSVFASSMAGPNSAILATSHLFTREVGIWHKVLERRRESELLKIAALEYEFALLALTQGYYRHAFKGLRLVLELILQAVYLSAREIQLREWLDHSVDTVWGAIIDENDGVFSKRFAVAFFPGLTQHLSNYRALAKLVYRECSECVHGNTPKEIPLPGCLEFNQETFNIWNAKAGSVSLVAHFALSLRYLRDFPEESLGKLEPCLSDRLGHLEEIRQLLGGPTEGL